MKFEIDLNEKLSATVCVIGGGTAGIFAAIASAASGAKTLLIEKNSTVGGTVTVGGVNFPGLFFAWGNKIIAGPCWEAIERTVETGGAVIPKISFRPEHHWDEQILLNRFVYESVMWQMLKENNVTVLANTMVSSVEEGENGVRLLITAKEGLKLVEANVVIDATGDANVIGMAGYPLEKSPVQQPATLRNHISGYNLENVDLDMLRDSFERESFPDYLSAEWLISYLRNHMIDVHIPSADADTSRGKTRLEEDAHALLLKIYRFYRTVKGLEALNVDYTAFETGVRESNRIIGESRITAEDFINGLLYPDSVCYAFYPIDLHVINGIKQTFFKENTVGKIPYGALIPKGSRRLLAAGRCISSDTHANSAVRVQAVCMATGQAAGCAAAVCGKENINASEVPYGELCKALKNIGAIVP